MHEITLCNRLAYIICCMAQADKVLRGNFYFSANDVTPQSIDSQLWPDNNLFNIFLFLVVLILAIGIIYLAN